MDVVAYFLSQSVLDGDLCECFTALPAARQRSIADDLGRSVGEVVKKLEDIRARIL